MCRNLKNFSVPNLAPLKQDTVSFKSSTTIVKKYDFNVVDLGELEYIGEDAWFNKTKIKDVSKLKFVGEYIYHRDSLLKNKDFSHIKRNHNPFFYFWDKIYYTPRDKEY